MVILKSYFLYLLEVLLYKVKKFYLYSQVLDHSLASFSREYILVAHVQFYDKILNKIISLCLISLEFIFLLMIES